MCIWDFFHIIDSYKLINECEISSFSVPSEKRALSKDRQFIIL